MYNFQQQNSSQKLTDALFTFVCRSWARLKYSVALKFLAEKKGQKIFSLNFRSVLNMCVQGIFLVFWLLTNFLSQNAFGFLIKLKFLLTFVFKLGDGAAQFAV